MDEMQYIEAFKELAPRLGIEIRQTSEGPSGLCTIRGEKVFFLNRNLGPDALVRLFVRDFRSLDLEDTFIMPVIRELLGREERHQNGNDVQG